VLIAGCAGELLLGGVPRGGGSDDPKIKRLLRGDAEAEAALRREVALFITGNYPNVLRVARALARRGVLTGDEVERLVYRRR
jgi:hypothetical protein